MAHTEDGKPNAMVKPEASVDDKAKPKDGASSSHEVSSKPKKRKRWPIVVAALCLVCVAAAACLCTWLPQTKVGQSIRAYDILNTWLEQPEQEMQLTVKARIDGKDSNFTVQITRTRIGDTPVSVISESGRRLYFARDDVFLENGNVYRLNGFALDYTNLLELVLESYKQVEFDTTDGIYTVTAEGEQAAAMLSLLLPSVESLLPATNCLTIQLVTEDETLTQIRFTGAGNLSDSAKIPFSLSAAIDVLPVSGEITVPQNVEQMIVSGNFHPQEINSDELVRLMEAWAQLRDRNPITAQIRLEADCGPLAVSDTFDYYQWRENGSTVQGIERDGKWVFFNDSGICDGEGKQTASLSVNVDACGLLDLAYRYFSEVDFQFWQEDSASIYLVSLEPSGMEAIANALLPQTKDLNVAFEAGSIRLVVENGQIQTLTVSCGGSSRVLVATVDYHLKTDVQFTSITPESELPEKVKEALLK